MSDLLDEDELRRQFHALAQEATMPAAPVRVVMDMAHRRRARGRAKLVVAVSVYTAVAATFGFALIRPHTGPVPAGATTTTTATAPVTPSAAATRPARVFDRNHWQSGPASPVLRKTYPYDLLVHCGVRYAVFGGKSWEATQVVPVPQATPDPVTGITDGMVALPGYMTLESATAARYDNNRLTAPVMFHLMDHPAPGCA